MSQPRIIATCGRKWEPDWLMDDWKENLSFVDGFAIADCRDRTDELWIDEYELYTWERKLAAELEADWILVVSPDERMDWSAERILRRVSQGPRNTAYRFRNRELYTPNEYRVDGDWGYAIQTRFYAFDPSHEITKKSLHTAPVPKAARQRTALLNCDLYHLKHIEPENRVKRAKVFEAVDPGAKNSVLKSYSELVDETGMRLEKIKPGFGYSPPYTKPYIFNPPKELYEKP